MGKHNQIPSPSRGGYTLIELLVVIAIIAVLVGMLVAGVIVVSTRGTAAANRKDLLLIHESLLKFKADKGQFPPSKIRLRHRLADYSPPTDQLDKDSVAFLSVMFPGLDPNTSVPWAGFNGGVPVPIPANGIILEGDQCMLFFLCGPPNQGGNAGAGLMGGFSDDPQLPVSGNATKRWMEIPPTARLVIRSSALVPNQLFPSYLDAYGTQPFMYFSSGNRPDGYDKAANSLGITPYAKNAALTQFYHPDTFQLISAGPDGQFGAGGLWTQGSAAGAGMDDVANFSDRALGIP